MTSATASDYAWIRSSAVCRYALETGYGLSLLQHVAPDEALRAMGAEPQGACRGVDALVERHEELRDAIDDHLDESFMAGACTVPGTGGDWTLVLHFDSGLGMTPELLEDLSAKGRAVMHSSNGGKPIHLFHWYQDGLLRTGFEGPDLRHGSTPDALLPLMREVGFTLHGDEEGNGPGAQPVCGTKAAVLALAERMTGVRLTEELLRDVEHRLGHVRDTS
jgi:hypothetical protein